jgi:hypothetical protein
MPNLVEQIDSGVFDVFQIPYSALQREHEGIIAKASAAGAGIIISGGVARGAPIDWNNRLLYAHRRPVEQPLGQGTVG